MDEKDLENLSDDLERLKNNFEKHEDEAGERFLKFEKKQDQILEILSDYKVLLSEIKNIKDTNALFEERLTRHETTVREIHAYINQRLTELEREKADKEDAKTTKGWVWAIVMLALTVLLNLLIKVFEGKIFR